MRIEYKHQHHQAGESVPAVVGAMITDVKAAFGKYIKRLEARPGRGAEIELSGSLANNVPISGKITLAGSALGIKAQNDAPLPWAARLFEGTIEREINAYIRGYLCQHLP
ncbi:hypothetical protein HYU13_01705 [Candidatus Woesearchaeota archaeon]|nr:hypothetical protein [Candidatus Woesearchaeota archaeon]